MIKLQLGDKVKDKVTGFTGIITGYARYLTGCDQYYILPVSKKNPNKYLSGRWFDDGRVEIIEAGVVKPKDVIVDKNGCDSPQPEM